MKTWSGFKSRNVKKISHSIEFIVYADQTDKVETFTAKAFTAKALSNIHICMLIIATAMSFKRVLMLIKEWIIKHDINRHN